MKNRKIIFLSMVCVSLSLCCSEENKAGPNTTVEQERRDLIKNLKDLANVNADKCRALRHDYDKLERRQCCRVFSVGCACLSLGILFTSVGFLAFGKPNIPLCPQATNSTCNCTSATPYNVTSLARIPQVAYSGPQISYTVPPYNATQKKKPIKFREQLRKRIQQPRGKR